MRTPLHLLIVACGAVLAACNPSSAPGPEVGSQTNWLVACESSEVCGDRACLCGACTGACESDADCDALPGSVCVPGEDEGAIALCGGYAAPGGLCLPRCEASCDEGTACVAGVCVPTEAATAQVTIDTAVRHQTLVGFGASLGYSDDVIVAHPDRGQLYDLLFADSGLDVLRVRNLYDGEPADPQPLASAAEIIAAAAERLGRPPLVFMTSGSPPASLKANGARTCGGNPETCTLVSLPSGGFDYAGFANYWRASLQAYADAGVTPDYVSIQNNPNWVPAADNPLEACRFLPEEGTAPQTVTGVPGEVAYPGYRDALAAVRAAIADMAAPPRLSGPEVTAPLAVNAYAPSLESMAFDALALHLYGVDPAAVDTDALAAVRDMAQRLGRPVFQTEMRADGLGTATLIHHTVIAGGASLYIQNDLVSLVPGMASLALALLTASGVEPQGPLYALSQYAKRTDPGWVRVEATVDATDLLGSAWLSPDEDALTVVLVNPSEGAVRAGLSLPDGLRERFVRTEVTRTVFEGLERATVLGELSANGSLHVPAGSVVTVAYSSK